MKFTRRHRPLVLDGHESATPERVGNSNATAEPVDQPLTTVSARPLAPLPAPAPGGLANLSPAGKPPPAWPVWLTAAVIAGVWALAPISFALGYRSQLAPMGDERFALAVFALLAIGPAALVFVAAYVLRQGQKLAFEAGRAKAMAEDMLTPAVVAAARSGQVAQAVREEIILASVAAEEARETLLALRDALAAETAALASAAAQSTRSAEDLAGTLGRERSELGQLSLTLDAQAARVTEAVAKQARAVAETAGAADIQLVEAERILSARTTELSAAAGEAGAAARAAGEDLTRHVARLETAGVAVADQVRAVETGLTDHRTALTTLSQTLRTDHGAFTSQAQDHVGKLSEVVEQARSYATEMSERAAAGGESLRALMADALLQFRDLAETARAEREEFGHSTVQSLEAVSAAAAQQRAELEVQTQAAIEALGAAAVATRDAAAGHALAAQQQVDQLSEAAFSAGQKANQVFEARLGEARALVEQSAKMVQDAGDVTARKLDEGAAATREALTELSAMLDAVEARARALPAAARGQAAQVRAAVADGMDDLMAQARRTAEEAQAIDAAFQERVRRNFDMLSDAVKLMGSVAAAPGALAPHPQSLAQSPGPAPSPVAMLRGDLPQPPEPEPEPEVVGDHPPAETPPAPEAPGAALALQIGLRQRLKLTPTASDQEFTQVFAAAGGPPSAKPNAPEAAAREAGEGADAWTWKDLLTSLDETEGDGEGLEDVLAAELTRMGVESDRLLPPPRVAEIAAAVHAGDVEGARQVVRKLAPAATRRIGRRLFTDEAVKQRADTYLQRYRTLTEDAIARDPSGRMLSDMLADRGGRTFLLFDAAAGDLI